MVKKRKLKVVLIFAPTGKIGNYNTPTGILYIATVLKKWGNKVKFVDCSVEPSYNKILNNDVKGADLLGVYAMSPQIRYLLPLLKKLKTINKKMKIIFSIGGIKINVSIRHTCPWTTFSATKSTVLGATVSDTNNR